MKMLILFMLAIISVAGAGGPCYSAVYSFGDSLADTGNLLTSSGLFGLFLLINRLPYGETHFNRPTGRCSNGRLIVDFLAQGFGLQMVSPFLEMDSDFSSGVNFAVAGATAMDASFFRERHIGPILTPNSLDMQIMWFLDFKGIYCAAADGDCDSNFENALFLMGEIGGNDLNYPLSEGRTVEEVRTFVPPIIAKIREGIETLITLGGAKKFIVQGNLPIGCSPLYLTLQQSSPDDYDDMGCITKLNNLSQYQNSLLQDMVQDLQRKHSGVSIIYADNYSAALKILKYPQAYGMQKNILKVCCGEGGDYNFSPFRLCGTQGLEACSNPDQYFNWDGIHLTEAAYKAIAKMFLDGEFTTPSLNSINQNCEITIN
eukprot:Gb_16975 [translate_table: standard]